MEDRKCPECGTIFTPVRQAEFCSRSCRCKSYYKRNKDEIASKRNKSNPKNCIICGNPIDYTKRHWNATTCSEKCAKERNKKYFVKWSEENYKKSELSAPRESISTKDIETLARERGTSYGKIQEERLRKLVKIERKW